MRDDRRFTEDELAEIDARMASEFAPFVNPQLSADRQTAQALEELYRPAEDYLRWPFPELDELTGPLGAGGDIWFVAAFSGSGKTTFIASCILAWMAEGKRVYAMPLEIEANRFRTYLACMRCEVNPGAVISGEAKLWPDWPAMRDRIAKEYRALKSEASSVMVSDLSAIDVKGLDQGLAEAKGFGADVVIIDHIDHISGGDSSSPAAESARVNHAALEIAKANNMLLVFTSQLNLDALKGNRDKLAKYAPPTVNQLWLPGKKLHVATGIVGLHRKVRDCGPNETADEYAQALKAARDGSAEPQTVLDPHVMGVNAMKLRNKGGNEGRRVYLGFESGRVVPLAERDRYQSEFGGRLRKVV
jgi:KaiC/GvpD/RAD55 family RecA-like ATPase